MLAALLTTVLFSLSGASGARLTRVVGGIEANFLRICVATVLLGLWAHTLGQGFSGQSLTLFLISGLIGFGIGDTALYQAFPVLGSRVCMILVHCLAAPMAAVLEWIWIGTVLTPAQIVCGSLTLAGVAVALAPSEHLHIPRAALIKGVSYGVVAALGQAVGSVISRKAFAVASAAGEHIDGITAAYQRIWGGVVIALAVYVWYLRRQGGELRPFRERLRGGWKWLAINGVAGPALGVSCYQWALATTPTGIVMPIVALTPLVIIPFARAIEGERATKRSLLGGAIAVLGVVGLRLSFK